MKRKLFFAILLLCSLLGYTSIAISQDSLPESPFSGGFNSSMNFSGLGGMGASKRAAVTVSGKIACNPENPRVGSLILEAKVPEGFHMYSITQAAGGPVAAKITLKPTDKITLTGPFVAQPAPKVVQVEYYSMPLEEQRGTVTWTAPIAIALGTDVKTLHIDGGLYYQICDDINGTCLEPADAEFTADFDSSAAVLTSESNPQTAQETAQETPVKIQPPFVSDPLAEKPGDSKAPVVNSEQKSSTYSVRQLVVWSFMAFLGGMILNVMPCVLPVISLKLMAFIEQAGESRIRIFMLNLWYVAGLMSVFVFLAFLSTYGLSLFTGNLSTNNGMAWGEMYSFTWVQIAMCTFIFLMALSLLGVWEIPIPGFLGTGAVNDIQQKEGAIGAFTKGIFTTLLAVPCVGPFLGPVLGLTLGEPFSFTLLIFGMIGLGMGFPYILVGLFPELLSFLPKPGQWMVTVRELMGFTLLATTVFFFRMIPSNLMVPVLSMLFSLWFLCWIVNKTPYGATAGQRLFYWAIGIGVAVIVSVGMFKLYTTDNTFPWAGQFDQSEVVKEHNAGRVVMIEFTADWCMNCKFNLSTSIEKEKVAQLIRDNNIYAVIADWTNRSETIKQTLNGYGRQGVPLLVILPPGNAQPILLDGVITSQQAVLDALNQALKSKPDAVNTNNKENRSDQQKAAIRQQLQNQYAPITNPQ